MPRLRVVAKAFRVAEALGSTANEQFLDDKPPELIDHMVKMLPPECLGTPEDIGGTRPFLLHCEP
ncbi:hypothetical protein [Novosphingobium sp. KN65.2]|uniref:hypothetical protein n=1 Tax=Novosphingobium sp. KN65.2 TaxID=1478134 RepID=UPI000B1BF4AE|nr:hypothetical protein [Novosphingobium sp. KN65.2]